MEKKSIRMLVIVLCVLGLAALLLSVVMRDDGAGDARGTLMQTTTGLAELAKGSGIARGLQSFAARHVVPALYENGTLVPDPDSLEDPVKRPPTVLVYVNPEPRMVAGRDAATFDDGHTAIALRHSNLSLVCNGVTYAWSLAAARAALRFHGYRSPEELASCYDEAFRVAAAMLDEYTSGRWAMAVASSAQQRREDAGRLGFRLDSLSFGTAPGDGLRLKRCFAQRWSSIGPEGWVYLFEVLAVNAAQYRVDHDTLATRANNATLRAYLRRSFSG